MKLKQLGSVSNAILALTFFSTVGAHAAEAPPAAPYSGDLWTRSTLSGDWWGVRNEMAAKGVTLDMSLTQAAQGIVARRQRYRLAVWRWARRHHSECGHAETRVVARRVL